MQYGKHRPFFGVNLNRIPFFGVEFRIPKNCYATYYLLGTRPVAYTDAEEYTVVDDGFHLNAGHVCMDTLKCSHNEKKIISYKNPLEVVLSP